MVKFEPNVILTKRRLIQTLKQNQIVEFEFELLVQYIYTQTNYVRLD